MQNTKDTKRTKKSTLAGTRAVALGFWLPPVIFVASVSFVRFVFSVTLVLA